MKTQHWLPTLLLTLLSIHALNESVVAQANIVLLNNDAANVGFNDPTPVAPIEGNAGTTLGQQRINAFNFAASIWGQTLVSVPTITVRASWPDTMPCTATSGTLASAGAAFITRDFPGSVPGTWYGTALGNAIRGSDLSPNHEINASFNIKIGSAGCLENSQWYYGLDTNHGNRVNFVTVVLHEFSHGLGFQTFTNRMDGMEQGDDTSGRFPTIYDRFLLDLTTGRTWPQMTNAERVASVINTNGLVWDGPNVKSAVPSVLNAGTPSLRINGPLEIARNYSVGTAVFGPALTTTGVTGTVIQTLDGVGPSTFDACSPLTNSVSGAIALVDRGTCTFVEKVKNAQNAGAVAVIVVNNVPGILDMGGTDPTIVIPSVLITQTDGNAIKAHLAGGVNATLLFDLSRFAGADSLGRPLMFTPGELAPGSSVSHWDHSATPNQLMEPNISNNLTHNVTPPHDLTFSLFRDIGWLGTTSNDSVVGFSAGAFNVNEGAGALTVNVVRSGATGGSTSVDYETVDNQAEVRCDTIGTIAFARCDYATTVGTLTFGPGETSKSFSIPIVDDSFAENNETFDIRLLNVQGATLGTSTATVTIIDNDATDGPNPIFNTPFFVRQHYLDFLSREPEAGEPWSGVLNNCSDVNNNPACDRLTVSAAFFGSPEFQLKGYFVYRFYKLAFNRLPTYAEISFDMAAVTGQTAADVFARKAAFTNAFAQRTEFTNAYSLLTDPQYVQALMGRYNLTEVTTPNPANPDGDQKVTLTTAQLGALTRAQVLRAIADSDQVFSLEFNQAFVAMQYFGYLRRAPEQAGFDAWLLYLNANPTDFRTMVNGFMNSVEYRLRFGPP